MLVRQMNTHSCCFGSWISTHIQISNPVGPVGWDTLHWLWIDERYQSCARRVWTEGWQNTFQLQYIYIYIHIWWLVTCWNQTYSLYWIYWFLIWGCVKPIIIIFWENTHPLNQLFRVHRVPGFWRNYPYMFADLIPDACWIATSFPPR